jgi:hypothetical protein
MMMKTFASAAFLFLTLVLYAKEIPRYPVSDIPEELIKGAHAVVREDRMIFTIESKSTASLRAHFVVTVLNSKGKQFATQAVWYDKLRKINSMKAQVLDASGRIIKKLKNSEITDHSAFEGMFSDNRMKVADLTQAQYPYTVEFEYDVAYKFLYHIDGSAINPYEDVSVQHASYQLLFPEALKPRYKTYNISDDPKYEKDQRGYVSLTWSFENIGAQKFEPYADRNKSVARIEAAPTVFEFEGYAGTMKSWDEYGQWIATLNKGRNDLPEETKTKIRELTANFKSPEDKIKALYDAQPHEQKHLYP